MQLFALLLLGAVAFAFETEEGVIVGSEENFDAVLAASQFNLVEFYAPWCGHCKSLAPEYAKAAEELASKGSPAKLVKVDATIHSNLAEKYGVGGYPTLKWFSSGKASEYNGGRTASEIIAWVNKKSGPPAVTVTSVEQAKALAAENEVFVLGYFSSASDPEVAHFTGAAELSETPFGITHDAAVAAEYKLGAGKIVLLKHFDEGRNDFPGILVADGIVNFVAANSMPLVTEFSDQTAPKIFGGSIKSHFLFFAKKSEASYKDLNTAASETAKQFKGKLLFVLVDGDAPANGRILDYFGLTTDDLPAARIINIDGEMRKYKPSFTTFDTPSLTAFAQSYVDGSLKPFLMTQKTPTDWDALPVKVLTGENFASVALDKNKHAFVEFYAPWCGHCKQLAPIWDKLGALYSAHPNIVIAKVDSTQNELEAVQIQGFPTLKFFPAASEEIVEYEGARTLKGFVDFIQEKTGVAVELSDEDAAAGNEEVPEEEGEGEYAEYEGGYEEDHGHDHDGDHAHEEL